VSMLRVRVEVDASEHTSGFRSSRGALFCEDVLPPRSRQILMVLSLDMSKRAHSMGMRYGASPLEPTAVVPPGAGHIPTLDDLGALAPLHEPQPINKGAALAAPPGQVDVGALAANIMSQIRPR